MGWPKGKPRKKPEPPPMTPAERVEADKAARIARLHEIQQQGAARKAELERRREQIIAAEAARPRTEYEKWEESRRPVYPSDWEPPEYDRQEAADTAQLILFGMKKVSPRYNFPTGLQRPTYVIQGPHYLDTRWYDADGNSIPVVQEQQARAMADRLGRQDAEAVEDVEEIGGDEDR
jgi:hypothetical protein